MHPRYKVKLKCKVKAIISILLVINYTDISMETVLYIKPCKLKVKI